MKKLIFKPENVHDEIYLFVDDINKWGYIKGELFVSIGFNIVTTNNNTKGVICKNTILCCIFIALATGISYSSRMISYSSSNYHILKKLNSTTKRLKWSIKKKYS